MEGIWRRSSPHDQINTDTANSLIHLLAVVRKRDEIDLKKLIYGMELIFLSIFQCLIIKDLCSYGERYWKPSLQRGDSEGLMRNGRYM